jgi:hypothetical protein
MIVSMSRKPEFQIDETSCMGSCRAVILSSSKTLLQSNFVLLSLFFSLFMPKKKSTTESTGSDRTDEVESVVASNNGTPASSKETLPSGGKSPKRKKSLKDLPELTEEGGRQRALTSPNVIEGGTIDIQQKKRNLLDRFSFRSKKAEIKVAPKLPPLPDTESLNKMFAKLLVRVITTRAKLVH